MQTSPDIAKLCAVSAAHTQAVPPSGSPVGHHKSATDCNAGSYSTMAQTLDDTLSKSLIASVLEELDRLHSPAHPPQDEYATIVDSPPAYNVFEEAYVPWHVADKAKQAIVVVLDKDPTLATAEKELRKAKKVLKEMQQKRCVLAS